MPPPPPQKLDCICGNDCLIHEANNGGQWRLCQLSDAHLNNILAWFENGIEDGYMLLGMLQGEMAIDSVESDLSTAEIAQELYIHEKHRRDNQRLLSTLPAYTKTSFMA